MIDTDALHLAFRARALSLVVCTTGSINMSATATGYARATGSFVTDGFYVGMEITPGGFASNPVDVVLAVADDEITTRDGRAAEAAADGRSLSVLIPEARAFDQDQFTPTGAKPYVDEYLVPGPSSLVTTAADHGKVEETGLYIFKWYHLSGFGSSGIRKTGDALKALFTPGTVIGPARVRTDVSAQNGQLIPTTGGWSVLTLTVPWRARTVNAATSPYKNGLIKRIRFGDFADTAEMDSVLTAFFTQSYVRSVDCAIDDAVLYNGKKALRHLDSVGDWEIWNAPLAGSVKKIAFGAVVYFDPQSPVPVAPEFLPAMWNMIGNVMSDADGTTGVSAGLDGATDKFVLAGDTDNTTEGGSLAAKQSRWIPVVIYAEIPAAGSPVHGTLFVDREYVGEISDSVPSTSDHFTTLSYMLWGGNVNQTNVRAALIEWYDRTDNDDPYGLLGAA